MTPTVAFDAYVRRRHRLTPLLRQQLGEASYEDAWNTGTAMTIDEAVGLAAASFTE